MPLRAIIRHRNAFAGSVRTRLLYSARSLDELIYHDELTAATSDTLEVHFTLTRSAPPGWSAHRGRVGAALLSELAFDAVEQPLVYICGPNGFVTAAADALVGLGYDAAAIRTERFGPSG